MANTENFFTSKASRWAERGQSDDHDHRHRHGRVQMGVADMSRHEKRMCNNETSEICK